MRAIKCLLIGLLLLPSWVHAAVDCADANAVSDTFGTPASPMVINYTRPSGSDFVGFALAAFRQDPAIGVSAITWGGNAMTQVGGDQWTTPAGAEFYRLIAPPSGTQTISTTWSGGRLTDSVAVFVCTGVDQTTPIRDQNSATGSGTTASVTVTSVNASDVVVACVARSGTASVTGSGSLVEITTDNASASEMNIGCWYQPGSAGGSVSVALSSSNAWTIHAASIAAAASADTGGDALWFP